MSYPSKPRQENTNNESTSRAPSAPGVERVAAPQVGGLNGGAPRIGGMALTPGTSPVRANNLMRQNWSATGTGPAWERTMRRTQMQADPGVIAGSLEQYWQGVSVGSGNRAPMPTPAIMPLDQAATYLKTLAGAMKAKLDAQYANLPEEAQQSRFWRQYASMPEPMSALVARRVWTNQMVGSGPVADWMKWLKG